MDSIFGLKIFFGKVFSKKQASTIDIMYNMLVNSQLIKLASLSLLFLPGQF